MEETVEKKQEGWQYSSDDIFIKELTDIKKAESLTPTNNPRRFIEQIYFKDDGTAWANINNSWVRLNYNPATASFNANKLQGVGISTSTPGTGQYLSFDGNNWSPTTITVPGVSAVEKTVTASGLSVGDLVSYIPAQTDVVVYRTVMNAASNLPFGANTVKKCSFKIFAPIDFTLKKITINITKQLSPTDDVKMTLRSTSETGAQLATYTVTNPNGSTDFIFDQNLTAGTTYYCVLERTGDLDANNNWRINVNTIIADTFHPNVIGTKILDSGDAWVSYSSSGSGSIVTFTLTGDITAGYKKWGGYRTNIGFEPFLGVVNKVSGSNVTFIISGYISGLSGLTAGENVIINNIVVGKAISATEAIIYDKKYGELSEIYLGSGSSITIQCNISLGWKLLTYIASPSGATLTEGTGYEYILEKSSATSAAVRGTSEYKELL